MAFRRNYIRKQFSNYLGEERAILDTFVTNEIVPTPTPFPICPQEINVQINGGEIKTLTRRTTYGVDNSLTTEGFYRPSAFPVVISPGDYLGDFFACYSEFTTRLGGVTLVYYSPTNVWSIVPNVDFQTLDVSTPVLATGIPNVSVISGGVYFLPPDTYTGSGGVIVDITYPSFCPTPTPTSSPIPSATPTPTPSITPTLTITPTPSITPTNTPSVTPTNTPTSTLTPTPTPSLGPSIDPDAALYLNDVIVAGGTVDATMSAATDTLFTDLKSNGIYNEMFAFYPIMGGTSASTAIMGKRASGTAFDVIWEGGWSFGVSGATGNGSNTYATFNISGGTVPATNSHITLYGNLPNVITNSGYDLSINQSGVSGKVSQIILNFNNTGSQYAEYNGFGAIAGGNSGDFIIFSRNAAGTETIRARNGVALSNKVEACNDIDNSRQWFLGAEQSNGGIKGASAKNRYCWVGFGNKLTDAQLLTYQNIINTFQTTLGRNTY